MELPDQNNLNASVIRSFNKLKDINPKHELLKYIRIKENNQLSITPGLYAEFQDKFLPEYNSHLNVNQSYYTYLMYKHSLEKAVISEKVRKI